MADERLGFRQAGWQIDLGGDHKVDVEFTSSRLWVALGAEVEETSLWVKGVQGFDIRVGVERQPDGLKITLDRGDNQPAWWTEELAPSITLRIDRETGTATVTASGPASQGLEMLVARTQV